MGIRVEYALRNNEDGRLVAFVERDFADLLLRHIKPKGIGVLKTEAHVEHAIRVGVTEAFVALREAR